MDARKLVGEKVDAGRLTLPELQNAHADGGGCIKAPHQLLEAMGHCPLISSFFRRFDRRSIGRVNPHELPGLSLRALNQA